MRIKRIEPAREFAVGHAHDPITLRHCADIELDANEQVTFLNSSGGGYDVVRKSWGFYATPSLNGRLVDQGFRSALVRSGDRRYLLLVERGQEDAFAAYIAEQRMEVEQWLDDLSDNQIKGIS